MESQGAWFDRPTIRASVMGVLRVLVAVGVVVAAYVLVPVSGDFDGKGWIVALVSMSVFAVVTIWQIRMVARSPKPIYRAVEALAVLAFLFLGLFALEYTALASENSSAFSEVLDKFSAFYYTITVFSTVGFGDISPVSTSARTATMVQMIGNLVFLGAVVRVVSGVAKTSRTRMKSGAAERSVDLDSALAEGNSARADSLGDPADD